MLSLGMIFGISGCSIEMSQTTGITPSPRVASASPIHWADLNLKGRLVYISVTKSGGNSVLSIQALNLATGEVTTIFTAPENSWIYYVTVSPDGSQLVMSYLPPSQGNNLGIQALYLMPLDGSKPPQLLITPPTQYDQYIQVEWSPDGKDIYFVHNNYHEHEAGQYFPVYEIFRMAYPDGQPEKNCK